MAIDREYQLKTERCILRHVSEEDIPHVFAATRFEGFNNGMTWDPPQEEADLLDPHRRNCEAWRAGTDYVFTIDSHGGELIGRVSIGRTDTEGLWNVGFWTHPDHQRKGYMTETLRSVLSFGFEELAASEIDAQCATWNAASRRVMEKCGMAWREQLTQGFQKGLEWVAVDRLSLTREKWREMQWHGQGPEESCVFCRILQGDLTPEVVAYRDHETAVFPSKAQQPGNMGHMLVVPVRHVAYLYNVSGDLAGPLMTTLARVSAALKSVTGADGITIRQNNEPHGGQDVLHVHFHVIPRFAGDGFNDGEDRFPLGAADVPLADRVKQAKKLSDALKAMDLVD